MTNTPDLLLRRARLPRWCLPASWPVAHGQPALADLRLSQSRVASVTPADASLGGGWDLAGAPVLPGLVDAHTHIDKTFTMHRFSGVQPGLLNAIKAMASHRLTWTAADVRQRLQVQDNPALVALDQSKAELQQAAQLAKNPKQRGRQAQYRPPC